ncbi:hypothetical protein IYY11_05645 [Methylocystis sp. H62]|uniref:hypothetical protein n=1 Tax=Methylocystis sp. H62 TaxID=2785789 RepID=UPI0018C2CA87|nr:hypothetical protein [Methylocystis sp. H62]MBG0792886.1 hypothetical protein [Methylocystis sp. H62]
MREPLGGALLYVLFGPVLWAIHLTLIYGGHTLLCALGVSSDALSPSIISFSVAIVTIVTLVVLLAAVVATIFKGGARGDRGSAATFFLDKLMMALALLSGFGVALGGASALIVEPCLMLR